MKKLFSAIKEGLEQGQSAVLCSIIASSGSAPRGAGAKMAVFADGTSVGSIGGGAVEQESARLAGEVLHTGLTQMKRYVLRPNEVADLGMVCGGDVTVYFQPLTAAELSTVTEILRLLDGEDAAWLVTDLETGAVRAVCAENSPEKLRPLLKSRAVCMENLYVEPLVRAGTVYIFGGGHVGKALAAVLAGVEFRVCVYDERSEAAVPENFPGAERVICGSYAEVSRNLSFTPADYAVVMTPGHQADTLVLEQVLRQKLRYVGCIGSRKKIERTNAALREAGISESAIASVHSPIGLPIFAETPEEIAVSVAAELIRVRAEDK